MMKKLFRYMIIATMIVIFIYSVFFDRSKNKKQPDIGATAKVEMVSAVADIAASIDTIAALCQEARHMEQVAKRAAAFDSSLPIYPFGELFHDLLELYQLMKRHEQGLDVDTARIAELERKLNCLTN